MDERNGEQYKSKSQKIRAITETWAESNMFCPYCGNQYIFHFENNRPVADFFCPSCREEYELKSNGTSIGKKVNDGANMTKEEMEKVALENDKIQASIGDKTVVKVIAIPKKLINIVVK